MTFVSTPVSAQVRDDSRLDGAVVGVLTAALIVVAAFLLVAVPFSVL